jgi:hypothetical protein
MSRALRKRNWLCSCWPSKPTAEAARRRGSKARSYSASAGIAPATQRSASGSVAAALNGNTITQGVVGWGAGASVGATGAAASGGATELRRSVLTTTTPPSANNSTARATLRRVQRVGPGAPIHQVSIATSGRKAHIATKTASISRSGAP